MMDTRAEGDEGGHQWMSGGAVLLPTLLLPTATSFSVSSATILRLRSEQAMAIKLASCGLQDMLVTLWLTRARILRSVTLPAPRESAP
jgi:hypothetical protein